MSTPPPACGTKNFFRSALPCMFSVVSDGQSRISVVEVTWDVGDVLETKDTHSAVQGGGEPDPSVSFVGSRISALDVGAELTSRKFGSPRSTSPRRRSDRDATGR